MAEHYGEGWKKVMEWNDSQMGAAQPEGKKREFFLGNPRLASLLVRGFGAPVAGTSGLEKDRRCQKAKG